MVQVNNEKINVSMIEPVGGHGGLEIYDLGVCSALIGNGCNVELFSCEKTRGLNSLPNLQIKRYFGGMFGKRNTVIRFFFFIKGLFLTVRDLLKKKPDIIYTHVFTFSLVEFLTILSTLLVKSKIFINVHDPISFGNKESKFVKFLFGKLFSLKKIELTTHTKFSRKVFIDIFPEISIQLMPHSDIDFIYDDNDSSDGARAIEDNCCPNVLFFGQIKQSKGVDTLLNAWSFVTQVIPDAKLNIVGRCWKNDGAQYQNIIDTLNLSNSVSWNEAYISDEDVPSLFKATNVVVLPYTRIYSSGVLLRAMGYGTPVIVSDQDAFTEIITHDTNGIVFETGNAEHLAEKIILAMQDSSKMNTLAKNAKKLLEERYAWSVVGEKMYAIFKESLDGPK